MDHLNVMLGTVEIMNKTDAVLDTVNDLEKDFESHGSVCEDTGYTDAVAGDAPALVFEGTECNDGERAILAGYLSLVRQCIELAEKLGAAKA